MTSLNLILFTLTLVGCSGFQASKPLASNVNVSAALLWTPGDQESGHVANGTVATVRNPNAQQSCQTGNGTGTQTCNSSGAAWGACGNLTSCNSGYNLQNGVCVADVCTPNTGATISIQSPQNYQVFQRNSSNAATVTVSGTLSSGAATVNVSAKTSGGNVVAQSSTAASSTNFSVALTLPAGGWYTLSVQEINS